MGRRPDSQHFVHEPLTNVGNPSEVHFHNVEVGFQSVLWGGGDGPARRDLGQTWVASSSERCWSICGT